MPWRSAITGEYVDHTYAQTNPDTTVYEHDPDQPDQPAPSQDTGMTDDLGPVPETPTDEHST